MFKRTILFTFALLALAFVSASADKVDDIINENKKACGSDALNKAKTILIDAEVSMMGQLKKISYKSVLPDKFKVSEVINGITTTLATDGKTGWIDNMGQKNILPSENVAAQFKQFEILFKSPFANLDRDSVVVKLAGRETIEGKDCYKLIATDKDSSSINTIWIDKKSKMVIQMSAVTQGQTYTIKMKGFKTFSGITVPTGIDIIVPGGTIVYKTNDLKLNTKIPLTEFTPPTDARPAPMGQ